MSVRTQRASDVRVSVVIPVKDDAEMLLRCLRALGHQSVTPHEVIVIDNGSTDASRAVAEAAGARVLVQNEPGIPAASAAGYDAANGQIIARLDADCVPAADWLARVVDAFIDDRTLGAVTGPARSVDGPRRLRVVLPRIYLGAYYALLFPALGHVPLFGSNMAMRRDAWAEVSHLVRRHDQMVHDDLDVAFHMGEKHKIRYMRELSMGISARPFGSVSEFGLRVQRGFYTVLTHWPQQFPPLRWTRRATTRRAESRRRTAFPRRTGP